jgi:transcriptional regulator with XRE-family HTH domain
MNYEDKLSRIGRKIREIRNSKNLSLREAARLSGVSPGLFSRIENFRTMPSLMVLGNIAEALSVGLDELVKDVSHEPLPKYYLVREGSGEIEQRADSPGIEYKKLITRELANLSIRSNLITVPIGVSRGLIATDGFEIVFVLSGKLNYQLNQETLFLAAGDLLAFEGTIPHGLSNPYDQAAVLFKTYLIPLDQS